MAKQDQVVKFSLVDGVSAGVKKIGESLKDLGSIVGKLTVAGAAVGAAIAAVSAVSLAGPIKEAVSLEAAMSKAAAATGATAEQLDQLKQAADEASRATGFSAEEAAQTLEQLGRAGLGAADATNALVPALNLAKAAAVSTSEAANILADTLDQFGLQGDQAGAVADKLAAGAKEAGTSLGQLTAGLTATAPQARALGLSLDTTVAALGLLARNGQEGGKAASGLRDIFASLEDPASRFRTELAKVGITSTDFTTVLQQLGEKGAAGEAAIQSLGTKGTAALQALLREGGGALDQFAVSIQNSNGALAGLAATFDNNVAAAFRKFQASFEALRIKLVEPLLGPIQREIEGLTAKLDEFVASGAFAKLQTAIKDAFEGAVKFVKDFVAEFDFTNAGANLAKFVSETGKSLKEAGEAARDVAALVKGAIDLVKAAAGGIEVAANAAEAAGARIAKGLLDQLPPVTQGIRDLQKGAGDLSIAFEDKLGGSIDQLARRLNALTGAEADAAEGATGGAAAQQDVVDITAQRSALIDSLLPKLYGAATAEEALAQAHRDSAAASRENQSTSSGNVTSRQQETKATDTATASTEKYGNTAEKSGNQAAQAGQQASDANEQVAETAGEAAEASGEAAEAAQDAGSATAGIMGLLQALNQRFAAVSENARLLFVDMEKAAVKGQASLRLVIKAIVEAGAATQDAIDAQRKIADGLIATFGNLETEGPRSLAVLERAFGGSVERARQLAQAARDGKGAIGILDQATLDQVGAVIDGAADKLQEMQDKARAVKDELAGIGSSLQDELDRLAGNETSIENRRFEQQLQRIRELAAAGDAEAKRQAVEAERLARAVHEANLRRIREEGQAQRDENTLTQQQAGGTSSGGGAGARAPTGGTVQNITINAQGVIATDVAEFVQKVKRPMEAALASLQPPRR